MKNNFSRLFMTIIRIAVIIFSICCICFLILISPYDEWNVVDYDMVDAEKVILLLLSAVNILTFLISKKSHRAVSIICVIITVICLMRFSWLLTL